MGSLFLVVTGAEALYADMGHLGRRPITNVWWTLVMPALLITYLGIGANLLRDPEDIRSPLFLLAPDALRLPFVVLATAATVIASQSLISGVFSITYQASKFGYAPDDEGRVHVSVDAGQVYLPGTNWILMIACVALVLVFRSSQGLAAAMGLSVTGTMLITTVLFATHARRVWRWPRLLVVVLTRVIGSIEGAFLVANLFKIPHGGWFTIAVAGVVFTMMTTWKTGRTLLKARGCPAGSPSRNSPASSLTTRTGSTASRATPSTCSHRRATCHPDCSHSSGRRAPCTRTSYVVTVRTEDRPHVLPVQRVESTAHEVGSREVVLHYGFMEEPTVARDLDLHLAIRPETTYYFVGRETVEAEGRLPMARWRESLFALMNRNAADVSEFFDLPADRVVELGQRVQI